MRPLLLLFLLSLTFAPLGRAEVIRYTDENGAIAFTDNIENVPEGQRAKIERVEPAAPQQIPSFSPRPKPMYDRWIDNPLSKYMIAFIALSILMLYIQSRSQNILVRLAMKLLFVVCLGAAIYSVILSQQPGLSTAVDKGVEPSLTTLIPDLAQINKAKEAVQKMESAQKRQEDTINELMKQLPQNQNREQE